MSYKYEGIERSHCKSERQIQLIKTKVQYMVDFV